MNPLTRARVEFALTLDELRQGKGDHSQQAAFQEWEWRRCSESFLYWLENYGFIKDKAGKIVKWVLWPIQRMLAIRWQAGESMVSAKSRQLGITTEEVHYFLWRTIFQEAAESYQVADSENKAVEAVKKLRVTQDRLPVWMKERASKQAKIEVNAKRDKSNAVKKIAYGLSEFNILTSTPNSVAGISGAVALDEFSRHKQQTEVLDNALPAVEGGGQLLIIGNGQGEDELYYAYTHAKKGGMPGFRAYFFWWGDNPTRLEGATIDGVPLEFNDALECTNFTRDELMAAASELSKSKDGNATSLPIMACQWYEDELALYLRKNADRDIWAFRAQHPSNEDECFYLSGNSFFDLTTINIIKTRLSRYKADYEGRFVEVGMLEPKDGGTVAFRRHSTRGNYRVFEHPEAGAEYVMGVDPAGGYGDSNYSVAQVCKVLRADQHLQVAEALGLSELERFENSSYALQQVCAYQARTDPDLMALVCERLGKWYNDALMVIERNNHGGTVIGNIRDTYFNLWFDRHSNKLVDDPKDLIGYHQSPASKTRMCDDLKGWLNKGWVSVMDSPTFDEMNRFQYREGKAPAASSKATDDLVVALGLCVVGANDLQVDSRARRAKILNPFSGLPME